MSTATASARTSSGESIGFQTQPRAQAESLQRKLAGLEPELVREHDGWLVEIAPDRRLTPLLLHVFQVASEWLNENKLASFEVHFGKTRYTLLHPSEARPSTRPCSCSSA